MQAGALRSPHACPTPCRLPLVVHTPTRTIPRTRRRSVVVAQAESTISQASVAIKDFLDNLKQPEGVGLFLDWVPDAALDALIEARKRAGRDINGLTAHDFCNYHNNAAEGALQFTIDSYAQRLLLWDHPRSCAPLSAISLGPEKSVHRFLLTSSQGEEVTVTAVVEKQEALQGQYRSAPRVERTWRLCSLTGEPNVEPGDVLCPASDVGPELVVAAQLQGLAQHNAARVFSFASPENQAVTGPVERFEQMLHAPQFRPLLGHSESKSLRRVMASRDSYMEVVVVAVPVPGPQKPLQQHWLYVWDVQRKGGNGAWMTNSVQLLTSTTV